MSTTMPFVLYAATEELKMGCESEVESKSNDKRRKKLVLMYRSIKQSAMCWLLGATWDRRLPVEVTLTHGLQNQMNG